MADIDPSCPGQWIDLNLHVDWYYDDNTLLTEASDADWHGYVQCYDVSYVSTSSDLLFRNNSVEAGIEGICGTQDGTGTQCGYAPTFNTFYCGGVGNCNGSYIVRMGATINLPPGWNWTTVPNFCSTISVRSMICAIDTAPVVIVPYIN